MLPCTPSVMLQPSVSFIVPRLAPLPRFYTVQRFHHSITPLQASSARSSALACSSDSGSGLAGHYGSSGAGEHELLAYWARVASLRLCCVIPHLIKALVLSNQHVLQLKRCHLPQQWSFAPHPWIAWRLNASHFGERPCPVCVSCVRTLCSCAANLCWCTACAPAGTRWPCAPASHTPCSGTISHLRWMHPRTHVQVLSFLLR